MSKHIIIKRYQVYPQTPSLLGLQRKGGKDGSEWEAKEGSEVWTPRISVNEASALDMWCALL